MLYHIVALFILLFLSAFFSGSETSIFSLSKISVKRLKVDDVKNSGILESLLNKPTDLLITILIGNMFANIFASSIAASLSVKKWGESGIGISIVVMTVIVVIFCEIMPKIIAIKNSRSISLVVSPFIRAFSRLVFPIRWVLGKLTESILMFFTGKIKKPESHITKDELESAIKVGYEEGGILDKEEAEMMEDVVQLSDKNVEDVMVQKKDIISFSITMAIEEMYIAIKEAELSRIPIYEKKRTNITGILYAKDLLEKKLEQPPNRDIKTILRAPFYVKNNMRLSSLLREFRTRRIHLALVNNEKGNLAGLVTLEDLLEEIIGDIQDKEALLQRIKKRYEFLGPPEEGA